jgi:hypothetical protein
MNAITRLVPSALGLTGLALTSLAAYAVAPASATPSCELTVHSNKVLELNDNDAGGKDEIFFKLGGEETAVRQYAEGQKRNNIGSKVFQNTIDVKVFERDASNVTLVGTLNNIPCQNETGEVEDINGPGDTLYRVRWSVD